MKRFYSRRPSEDGVALIFALAMLALLLIMLIGFLASGILEQRIAYSYRDDVGSRLLARSAMVRVLAQLRNATDDMLFIRNGSSEANIMTPLVSISNIGTPNRSGSEPAASVTDSNGNPRYAYKALKPLLKKYFGPDTSGNVEDNWEWSNWLPQGTGAPNMYYPEWIYYYQRSNDGGSNDYLTGRMAYVVIPNLGLNLSQFGSGNDRNGVYYDELPQDAFLTADGRSRLSRLTNWLSPDILLGNPGLYSNSSTVNNTTNSANGNFNFAQLDITNSGNTVKNFFSGSLGGVMNSNTTPGDYREFATLFLTGDDREYPAGAYNETDRQKTGTTLQIFPSEATHSVWQTFITTNFDITGNQADQVAANIVDYIDADNIPTSNVAAASWNTTTTHPTYTGNEKTPYINQIVPAFELTGKYTEEKGSAADGMQSVTRKLSFTHKGKIYVELINIYPEDLSNVRKIVIKDVSFALKGEVRWGTASGTVFAPATTGDNNSGEISQTFSKDQIEISTGDDTDITVSANGYAVVAADVTFSGSIAAVSDTRDMSTSVTPAADVNLKVKDFKFERAVLLDKDGNGLDFVKGMTVPDGERNFIGTVETDDPLTPDHRNAWVFTGSTSTMTSTAYADFQVNDPRCNLTGDNWEIDFVKDKAAVTQHTELALGGKNKNSKPQNDDLTKEQDLEPEEDPAKISGAYIRNGAMASIFEFGLIHRGKPWQTFNLRSTPDDPDLNAVTPTKLTYLQDAKILERYRFGTVNDAPRFNVNHPANMTGAFAPLVEGLEYNTLPGLTKTTLDDNAKRDLRLWLANKCYKAGGDNPTANTAECYNRYVRHSEVVNVITDWALNSTHSPIRTNPTDAAIEELVAKIVPLVRFGEMYEYYTVFAVAQTIKDFGGTIYRYNNSGNLQSYSATAGRWDANVDMITSETYLVARIRRTIQCQTSDNNKIRKSCLWGQHSTDCTKNVQVLECYTVNPD